MIFDKWNNLIGGQNPSIFTILENVSTTVAKLDLNHVFVHDCTQFHWVLVLKFKNWEHVEDWHPFHKHIVLVSPKTTKEWTKSFFLKSSLPP